MKLKESNFGTTTAQKDDFAIINQCRVISNQLINLILARRLIGAKKKKNTVFIFDDLRVIFSDTIKVGASRR